MNQEYIDRFEGLTNQKEIKKFIDASNALLIEYVSEGFELEDAVSFLKIKLTEDLEKRVFHNSKKEDM